VHEKNRDILIDPGYRCWVEYFFPGFGWNSADLVEADTPSGLGHERWISGITSRRLYLIDGREFRFCPSVRAPTVNSMGIAHAEIDGNPVRLLPEAALKP
jgi:hypothetical protein